MTPGKLAQTSAVVATGAYTALLLLAGVPLGSSFKHLVSFIPVAVVAIFVATDEKLWKWKLVQRVLRRPRLEGTWRLALEPTADSHIPPGGNRGPIDAFCIIEQTWWGVHVTQVTKESKSDSVGGSIISAEGTSQRRLLFPYTNVPEQKHQPRSTQHNGCCSLAAAGLLPETMTGFYFTNRLTRGDIAGVLLGRATDVVDFAGLIRKYGPPA